MKITVINGTQKQGVTYQLKELFLENFRKRAEITEYDLPKDCPAFCTGCLNCIFKGEHACKDSAYVQSIAASLLEADLIVMTSPAYVFHTTGAMKAMLDHFAYLWIPHRPAPEMFLKRAVIITQCLGAGAASTAKDIKHSLSWWGISEIKVFKGQLMEDVVWDRLTEKRRMRLTKKIKCLSGKFSKIDYGKPVHSNLTTKMKFEACRIMQKSLYEKGNVSFDGKYWAGQGWFGKARPWRMNGGALSFSCRN